jgi:hypothetical protein
MRHAFLAALLAVATGACTSSTPGADTTRPQPPADSAPAVAPPAVPPVAPPATTPAVTPPSAVDTAPPVATPPAGRPTPSVTPAPSSAPSRNTPAAQDTTPTRPRMTPRPPRPVPRPMPPQGAAGDVDQPTIDRLRAEAKALVKTDGCATSGDCAVLPLGERACGGPEEYLVYCPKSTDVAALRRKAAELAQAQKAFNEKNGVMSTCEFRMPPKAVLVGGSCRAATVGMPDAPATRVP